MITRRTVLATAMSLAIAASIGFLGPRSQAGQTLQAPSGKPILSIEGRIHVANTGGRAVFDRQMLESMGTVSITTSTPWFDSPVTFEGVPLKDLMSRVEADGTSVVAIALNDYRTTIPLEDFYKLGPVLALKRDGNYMPVSDKGPLFIVYPYDSDPALHNQKYYGRSVWQLSRLIIE